MVKVDRKTWKKNYFQKLYRFFEEYSKVIIVGVDNVRSKQLQNIRIALRSNCEILMGKNTLVRRALLDTEKPELEALAEHVRGNVGFIFTNDDLLAVRAELDNHHVAAPARVGAIAPEPVVIPAGPTGQDAQKTSFFQALNIPTKISRGAIEIISDVRLLQTGDRVGPSESALLNMLNISPFSYGLELKMIYEKGSIYEARILDITEADILAKFAEGLSKVASVSLALGLPNAASVSHMIMNGYKNVLALAVVTEITFPLAEKVKAFLENPEAFVVAAPAAEATPAPAAAAAAPEESEEDDDMDGFSLFD